MIVTNRKLEREIDIEQMKHTKLNLKNIACIMGIVSLFIMCIPLLVIAHYNFPCTDDFCYGILIRDAVINKDSFWSFLGQAFAETGNNYLIWQGRYVDNFLSLINISVIRPQYYAIFTYVVLINFLISGLLFCYLVGTKWLHCGKSESLTVGAFLIMAQILFVPYASEGFFWYVGATSYTIGVAFILYLFSLLILYISQPKHHISLVVGSYILCFLLGGSNYATGILTIELLVLFLIGLVIQKKRWGVVGGITGFYFICFLINVLAPGNLRRQTTAEGLSVMESILFSLRQMGTFLGEWTHITVLLILLLMIPFLWKGICNTTFAFRLPFLYTVISYGVLASVMAPAYYGGGTWGPGRLINVIYFMYYYFLVSNMVYWLGYLTRLKSVKIFGDKCRERMKWEKWNNVCILPYTVVIGLLLLLVIKSCGANSTSSTSAFFSLYHGEAQQYYAEQQERLLILQDASIQNAEVEAFTAIPSVLFTDELQEDATDWRNAAIAMFYQKETIKRVPRK